MILEQDILNAYLSEDIDSGDIFDYYSEGFISENTMDALIEEGHFDYLLDYVSEEEIMYIIQSDPYLLEAYKYDKMDAVKAGVIKKVGRFLKRKYHDFKAWRANDTLQKQKHLSIARDLVNGASSNMKSMALRKKYDNKLADLHKKVAKYEKNKQGEF